MKQTDSMASQAVENGTATDFRALLLNDYRLACMSREASLLGRKEVLGGKAKFGIFGDGKELAQIALSKVVREGDWRSGYYRDQTLMMAKGLLTVEQYFAALYADTDLDREPTSAGRQMGGHFATRFLDENGDWFCLFLRSFLISLACSNINEISSIVKFSRASKDFRFQTIRSIKCLVSKL